ncbi:MAG: phosphate acyltransferase PlsX [Planctomycetota bacterium]
MARIGIDAMGGDHGPKVTVEGAVMASANHPDAALHLVGDQETIQAELDKHGVDPARFVVHHASQAVEMHESPVDALRKKPDSSIRVMMHLLKEQKIDTVFSAGNTGAMVAAATMGLGLLPGVSRAGILITFPLGERPTVMIDAGANIQCKPLHLYQYALMANEFTARVYGVEKPSVGLLNVGEEEEKGNQLVKETRDLLAESPLHYIGNVEGGDIFMGDCDVIVCDGFVGNIVLKVSEGLSERMIQLLKGKLAMLAGADSSGGMGALSDSLGDLANMVDYSEYGGAPLLGVAGNVIIGHGRSDAKAVASALRLAWQMHHVNVKDFMGQAVESTG